MKIGKTRTFKQHTMKINTEDINGKIIRDTAVYQVIDNELLKNLTVSKTILHPGQKTTGHSHPGLEEVYFFIAGSGTIQLSNDTVDQLIPVHAGDIVLIEDNMFHRVFNESVGNDLEFICVFQKYDR
jgi:mannose-6-phosphate isomerase-like protein (cupin superfamily)